MKTTSQPEHQTHREIAKLLAVTLLQQRRKISYTEIEALPVVARKET